MTPPVRPAHPRTAPARRSTSPSLTVPTRPTRPTRSAADNRRAADDGRAPDDGRAADDGRALLEVIFLAVLILIPTVYILAAVMRIQAATFAVTQAARDAGRVMDSAPTLSQAITRAHQIAQIALTDQHVPTDGLDLRFVPAGADCTANQITPSLRGGDVYDICVIAIVTLPGVPTVMTGSNNTITGIFTMHVGDFREGP